MSLTVDQINKTQFNTKMRGYNQNEVNNFIQEVSQTVQELTDQVRALQETVQADEGKLKYFSELKDSLNKSILVAQEAADKVKNNAKREADIMIREAQKQATDIVSTANEKANQVIENSTEDTRKLTTETNDLKKQTRIFRQRLQVMLESQLEVVKSDEWDKLLANDDLDKYDEIQKILGTRLDSDSSQSVESTTTNTNTVDQPEEAPVAASEEPEPASEEPVEQVTDDTSTEDDSDNENGDSGETVVVFPDDTNQQ